MAAIPTIFHRKRTLPRSKKAKPDFLGWIHFCRRPRIWRWLLLMLLYIMGRSMAVGMLQPLLVDVGLSIADMGIVGFSIGTVAAIIGGLIIDRLGRKRSLIAFGLVSAIANLLNPDLSQVRKNHCEHLSFANIPDEKQDSCSLSFVRRGLG
ncbi:MFS transporter [Nostoc sp.]|uniref:MFS transporter n=1 Tax=Nostoc sp. TaxID=1180 RepID=UPI002FFD3431